MERQPPSEAEWQQLSPDQHCILTILPQIVHDKETEVWVVRKTDHVECLRGELLLFVLHSLWQKVVEAAHQFLGRAGQNATYGFYRTRVFMPRLCHEVANVIKGCHPCQLKDQSAPVQHDVHLPSIQGGAQFQV